jgi:CheY-like chemotaxis protein
MLPILLIEDDADQLAIRKLLFERLGYPVAIANSAAVALEEIREHRFGLAIMDLRLPTADEGKALIRVFRERAPGMRIIVLSGWIEDLEGSPEAALVDSLLRKPVRPKTLIATVARLALLLLCFLFSSHAMHAGDPSPIQFQLPSKAEIVLELQMTAYGSDWSRPGSEAPCARLTTDGALVQHVLLWAGANTHVYHVFLGALDPGWHKVIIERDKACSAGFTRFELASHGIRTLLPGDADYDLIANAPILYPEPEGLAKFSAVPLLVFATRTRRGDSTVLQYNAVYSGQKTPLPSQIMATRGHTLGLQTLCEVTLGGGKSARSGHQEIGSFATGVRFQIVPIEIDRGIGPDEQALDGNPHVYETAAFELRREGRIRWGGESDAEAIADPRDYLVVEAKVSLTDAALQSQIRLRGRPGRVYSSLGLPENYIRRSGWVRMGLETPRGLRMEEVVELDFDCAPLPGKTNGVCVVEAMGKVFFLDSQYKPLPSLLAPPLPRPLRIPAGQTAAIALR